MQLQGNREAHECDFAFEFRAHVVSDRRPSCTAIPSGSLHSRMKLNQDFMRSCTGEGIVGVAIFRVLRCADRTTTIGQMINAYLTNATELDDHTVHLLFSGAFDAILFSRDFTLRMPWLFFKVWLALLSFPVQLCLGECMSVYMCFSVCVFLSW